jgi:hypothetical protein
MKAKITSGLILANMIVIGLAAVSVVSMYSVNSLYPLDGTLTDDRRPVFEWTGAMQSYELLIDDNPDFTSPMTARVSGNSYRPEEDLDFGSYWWKVRSGDAESGVSRFALVSTVALSRLEKEAVRNSGNTPVLVQRSGITAP